MDISGCIAEAERQLSDQFSHEELDNDPTDEYSEKKVTATILDLQQCGLILTETVAE